MTAADIHPGNITDLGGTPFIVNTCELYHNMGVFRGHTAAFGADVPWVVMCYDLREECDVVQGRWE